MKGESIMAGSTYGNLFRITTWGESHGPALGVVIDGCPAGLPITSAEIQDYLNRRKPGQSKFSTARKETDQAHILSGVFEGRTTGTPISIIIYNQDQHSKDYHNLQHVYRPGHADYTFDAKYGIRDHRGGGRSSGRETIGRVAAGAIASKILSSLGIRITTYTKSIGNIRIPSSEYHLSEIKDNAIFMPNNSYAQQASELLNSCIANQDSVGGVIECMVTGIPAGIGEPVFAKLDAALTQGIMSIGAVKGVEIGDGFEASQTFGSENNDAFYQTSQKTIAKKTNHSGGVLGGISDGSPILLRAAVKPTPSIAQEQQTITSDGQSTTISITGRHDPVIVPRAVVVVESMVALTLVDYLFANMSSKMESVIDFYK